MEELPNIPEHSSGRMIPLAEVLLDRTPSRVMPEPPLQQYSKINHLYRRALIGGAIIGAVGAGMLVLLYLG